MRDYYDGMFDAELFSVSFLWVKDTILYDKTILLCVQKLVAGGY